jgi:hypothetical protein
VATLIDLLDRAVERNGERPALGLRRDDGTTEHWTSPGEPGSRPGGCARWTWSQVTAS